MMHVKIAKNHYLGQEGAKRLNCAQSIISAFKDKYDFDEKIIDSFWQFGSGRAPDGQCGAYYAAKYILENKRADIKTDKLDQYFIEQAGSLVCHDIRKSKKLSCARCVEKSAEFIAAL